MDNETNKRPSTALLIAIVISVSIALRLIGLGSASLTQNEAENALSAIRLFSGGSSSQLLYALPTALLFRMFGDTDFTARLFPALMGILLSIMPLCIRKKIGTGKAVILSMLLAVDPTLLFWSKRADAVIPTIAMMAAAGVCLLNGKKKTGITCFLIALCGGERCFPALIVFALAGVICMQITRFNIQRSVREKISWRDLAIPVVIFLAFITACGTSPSGISAFGSGIAAVFGHTASWMHPGIVALFMAILVYLMIPLILFVCECISGHRPAVLYFVLLSGVILLLWQGVMALPWAAFMLCICAAEPVRKICGHLGEKKNFPFYVAAGAVTGAYAFLYFRLVEMFNQRNGYEPVRINWNGTEQTLPLTRMSAAALLTVISVVILALVVKILLGFFDSASIRRGILGGLVIICGWGLCTNIWNVGGFDRIGDHPVAVHPQNSLLLLNGNFSGFTDSPLFELIDETVIKHGDQPVHSYGLNFVTDDPLLEWQLRNYKGIETAGNAHAELPDIDLMLNKGENSYNENGYVSSTIPYRTTVDWERLSFQNWGNWMLFGDGPVMNNQTVTLWVRGDYIFTGEK